MSVDYCQRCGAALPNAAGPGLYCPECGEPVHRDDPTARLERDHCSRCREEYSGGGCVCEPSEAEVNADA